MGIDLYENKGIGVKTKVIRFKSDTNVKMMIGCSVSTDGKKWVDKNRRCRSFGLFKQKEGKLYTALALIVGKRKFTLIRVGQIL